MTELSFLHAPSLYHFDTGLKYSSHLSFYIRQCKTTQKRLTMKLGQTSCVLPMWLPVCDETESVFVNGPIYFSYFWDTIFIKSV